MVLANRATKRGEQLEVQRAFEDSYQENERDNIYDFRDE